LAEHTLDRSRIHHDWDNSYEPVLSIASGDVVHLDLLMAGHGQVHEHSAIEDVVWDGDRRRPHVRCAEGRARDGRVYRRGARDAYVLASVAGDLHIHEIVDAGVWNVGMTLPLNVFV
jgi:acetamidase/formamidase